MKISCIQMDMEFGNPEHNYAHAERQIRAVARKEKPDGILLPEMWNTGFFPKTLSVCADRNGERTKHLMGDLARELNVNIVAGSVAVEEGGAYYNTCYIYDRKGQLVSQYRKTHLFSPSGEGNCFRAGDTLCRFQLDGIPCGVIICYDLRFPELTRSMALEGLDLLFVPAQWPDVRVGQMEALARARAIENQMFLALCNSPGTAGDTRYGGHSTIFDPLGGCLAQARASEETIIADLDLQGLRDIRESINVFRDRRPTLYQL